MAAVNKAAPTQARVHICALVRITDILFLSQIQVHVPTIDVLSTMAAAARLVNIWVIIWQIALALFLDII